MTLPLILCLTVTVIPAFFSRIASAPTWLAFQALTLGWITLTHFEDYTTHALLIGAEILLVRAVLVPTLLRRVLKRQGNGKMSLMPSNLFTWVAAVILIILAFKFGDGARVDVRALTLGVVAATVMIAFLILASNHEPKAQLVALLFMENALALFETLMPKPWPLTVHIAVSTVYVLTVCVGAWLVADPVAATSAPNSAPAAAAKEIQ